MKKVFIYSFLTAIVCLPISCSTNGGNSSQETAVSTETNANQANSNVKTQESPLPIFTNADEAMAEGKKQLDALETERAIDALKQAVKLNPDLAEAHFNLGIAYALIEKDEEDAVKTQVEATPTPVIRIKKGKKEIVERTKESEKAFENAVKAYKKILAQNAKDDAAQFNLGRAYNKLNEDDDARDALKEAVKLKPDDAEYQTEYGAILIKLAQYDEAVSALKKAVSLDEENLKAQDLLEKAEAGKKRVSFGLEQKTAQQQQQKNSRQKESSNQSETNSATNTAIKTAPTPVKKNANQ